MAITDPQEIEERIHWLDVDGESPEDAIKEIETTAATVAGKYLRLKIETRSDGDECDVSLWGTRMETPLEAEWRVARLRGELKAMKDRLGEA